MTLGQTVNACTLHGADVHEHVLAAIFALNEAEALLGVEELDGALALANDLRRHPAATATAAARAAEAATTAAAARSAAEATAVTTAEAATITAAETTATAAAAEAITATAAAAEAITAAKAVATAHEGIETFFAEPVALVSAPAATPSVKTHKPERTFASPYCSARCDVDDSRGAAGQAAPRPSPLHSCTYTK
jgi:hypothetical protein